MLQGISPVQPFPTYGTLRRRARSLMERDENTYEVIYLPLVVAEVVWDFTDTVCDGLSILRDPSLKGTARRLREMRKDYRSHFGSLSVALSDLQEFSDRFIEYIGDARSVTRELSKALDSCGVDVPPERRGVVIAAHVAGCFAEGLVKYSAIKESGFARKAGLPDYGCILPDSFRALPSAMREITAGYRLPSGVTSQVVSQILDLLLQTAEEMTEPEERMRHRLACVAYRNNGGCRAQARRGTFGCYPSSKCKRMTRYDNQHKIQRPCTAD